MGQRDLYVVAHPEATHAVDLLVGGWYDSELTDKGRADAGAIATHLKSLVPADGSCRVFASDLRRTRDTGGIVSEALGSELNLDVGLREQSYGVAEGRPPGTVPFTPPPPVGDRMRHHDGVDGSETRWQWASRVYAAMQRILEQPWNQAVVITHGGSLTYVVAAWVGMPLDTAGYIKLKVSAGSITHLREDDQLRDRQVVTLNDRSHLTD